MNTPDRPQTSPPTSAFKWNDLTWASSTASGTVSSPVNRAEVMTLPPPWPQTGTCGTASPGHRWFGVVVGATPRLGELRRGELIPWRVIAVQIAPRERRDSR